MQPGTPQSIGYMFANTKEDVMLRLALPLGMLLLGGCAVSVSVPPSSIPSYGAPSAVGLQAAKDLGDFRKPFTVDHCDFGVNVCVITVTAVAVGKTRCVVSVVPDILVVQLQAGDAGKKQLKWVFDTKVDTATFRFERDLGIDITGETFKVDDDDKAIYGYPPRGIGPLQEFVLTYGKAPLTRGDKYNINIQRNVKTGPGLPDWVSCGSVDPLIVNRG